MLPSTFQCEQCPHWKVSLLGRSTLEGTSTWDVHIGGYLNSRGPHWKVHLILFRRFLEYSSKMILNFIVIQKRYSKYNRESTDVDFDSDLVVEGVVLELQSLNTILKNF